MVDNGPMVELYRANLARTGRTLVDPTSLESIVGSTDMGNVSHLVPSIHPTIAVSPPTVAIHTQDFVRYAGGAEGDAAVIDGARAMAATVVDLWARPGALEAAREAFARDRDEGRASGSAVV
jgi:metal-dependent amidase/aminoacylase/carboxypeptidase family protein